MKITQGNINDRSYEHGKKKSCTQLPKPGVAQEGCAFDGAMNALVPITDAAHLVHGPITCAGSWGGRGSFSSNSMIYKIGFSTDIEESDIIFGGAKKLYKAIVQLERRYKPTAVFVYSTCITALIGDDMKTICKTAAQDLGIPIIPVNSPGFTGGNNLGNRLASEALLEHVVGTAEPEFTTLYDINLIGEYNIKGEIWNILPLLEKLGIRVLAKITGDASYKEICYAHRAKLNVMCSKSLLHMARKMEELYGIPYIENSFYGLEDINSFLRNIAAKLGERDLVERTEKLIAQETAAMEASLAPYRQLLQGKRVVFYTNHIKIWSMISAANQLGMEVIVTSNQESTEEDKARIKRILDQDGIILDQESPKNILQIINENQAHILVANSSNQHIALVAGIPFLNINQERNYHCAGYAGILAVAKDLYQTLTSPVWEQVRKPVSWEV